MPCILFTLAQTGEDPGGGVAPFTPVGMSTITLPITPTSMAIAIVALGVVCLLAWLLVWLEFNATRKIVRAFSRQLQDDRGSDIPF